MKLPFRSRPAVVPVMQPSVPLRALPPRRFDEAAEALRSAGSHRPQRRNYFSIGSNAAFLGWDVDNVSADTALYGNINRMQARCRDLARNNDYIKMFLRLLRVNVVGPTGIQFQSRRYAGESLDRPFNTQLQGHWRISGKPKNSPTVCGRMSRRELAELWITTLAVTGEVLEVDYPGYSNKYRFATRIVDSALIDFRKNELLPNGNRIKMGVEVDEYDKPVAYWLLARHPNDIQFAYTPAPTWTRISADRARLTFLQESPGQTRGVSWLASPAVRAQMLQKFEEAVIVTSRAAASKGGFYKVTEDFEGDAPGDKEGDGDSGGVDLRKTVEPGEWEMLPRGVEAVPYDPAFPPANMAEMSKVMLRGIASGLGGQYHAIANDLENVNYTSSRVGNIEQRAIYRSLQQLTIDHHEEPLFEGWAKILRMNPDTPIDGRKLDALLLSEDFRFIGRGWEWVDPQKEVAAYKEAIDLKITTRAEVIASTSGREAEDVWDDLQEEERALLERGLDPAINVVKQQTTSAAGGDPPAKDE